MPDRPKRRKRRTVLSEDDRRLFRDSVGPLRRLRVEPARRPGAPRPAAVPSFTLADEERVRDELLRPLGDAEPGEILHAQPGLKPDIISKLRRGRFRIDAEIDLHAMTEGAARAALLEFLNECRRERLRCIRVVHGKGLRSGHAGPVIKPMVERELMRRKQVLAFCSARPAHGGTGAVCVLLRR